MFIPLSSKPSRTLRPDSSGISDNDWAILADFWFPVAIAADVQDKPVPATLLDVDLVLYRGKDRTCAAALDVCPHRQVRLSIGSVIDGEITCPFHGLRFDTSGRCQLVPALGKRMKLPEDYRVRTFPVKERYGLLWTCLGDASRRQVPHFPHIADVDPALLSYVTPQVWPVSAARQIENFFDLAHLPFVHANTLGGDPNLPMKPGQVEQTDDEVVLTAQYVETPPNSPPRPCTFIYRMIIPFAIDFTVKDESPHQMRGYNMPSPVNAHQSKVFQIIRFLPDETSKQRAAAAGFGEINAEDMRVLATLRMQDMPLDQHHEIHLPVDNICGAYRAKLRGLGLGL